MTPQLDTAPVELDDDEAAYEDEEAERALHDHEQYHRDGMCPCPVEQGWN